MLNHFASAGSRFEFNSEQRKALFQTTQDPCVNFYAVPSSVMISLLVKGTDPILCELPKDIQKAFLNGKAILFDQLMLLKKADHTLDLHNDYFLDLCDIKYEGSVPYELLGAVRSF